MQPLLLLLLLACLLPPRAEAGEIIGGHEARPHSRPYMACLRISVPESESWFGDKPFNTMRCGGFLIREDFVLTAAHCNGRSIRIILGAHDVTKQERTWQVTAVRRAIPHPDYNRENCANDIMLLQLERNAKLNDAVKIIRLPSENNSVRPGRLCTVAGWGLLGVTDQPANKLQEADLRVQKESVCLRWFPHHIYDSNIQLCAGDRRTRKASYEGDSGGPLVCSRVAQGIVSFGREDKRPPCVFTRISSFMPWIKKTMRHFTLQGPGQGAQD